MSTKTKQKLETMKFTKKVTPGQVKFFEQFKTVSNINPWLKIGDRWIDVSEKMAANFDKLKEAGENLNLFLAAFVRSGQAKKIFCKNYRVHVQMNNGMEFSFPVGENTKDYKYQSINA